MLKWFQKHYMSDPLSWQYGGHEDPPESQMNPYSLKARRSIGLRSRQASCTRSYAGTVKWCTQEKKEKCMELE